MDTNLRLCRIFFLQVFSFRGMNDTCQLEGDFRTFLSLQIETETERRVRSDPAEDAEGVDLGVGLVHAAGPLEKHGLHHRNVRDESQGVVRGEELD